MEKQNTYLRLFPLGRPMIVKRRPRDPFGRGKTRKEPNPQVPSVFVSLLTGAQWLVEGTKIAARCNDAVVEVDDLPPNHLGHSRNQKCPCKTPEGWRARPVGRDGKRADPKPSETTLDPTN